MKTNNLINETSPYLLQHAHNPVNWYPWGSEAFSKAQVEDKPVFLSIGYSTCHWCHVMEDESFEDEEVAEILNKYYVAIKVDKEERPDIDSIYMNVCVALTGSGGWPLTILLTPEKTPFFAGTYIPKNRKYNLMGLIDLLNIANEKWKNDKDKIINESINIVNALNNQKNIIQKSDELSSDIIDKAFQDFISLFDNEYGGFGKSPKFPTPHNILFLLRYFEVKNNHQALNMAEKTLNSMYRGGIFDHIGYGFSRYSTDEMWLVPHFEKMLYDNAMLTVCYLEAYRITKKENYKIVAEKTLTYIMREMTDENGGFYTAQDADTEREEGKYYVFSPDEIINLLGKDDGDFFNKYFNITKQGNFEGKNIPNLIYNKEISNERVEKLIPKVYQYRKSRTELIKDDKILTSWNSLMIYAFIKAYRILKDDKYLVIAKKALNFIENNMSEDLQLYVSFRKGKLSNKGFLDDYAFLIFAYIEYYKATFDKEALEKAIKLSNETLKNFWDEQNYGFYLYGNNSENLIIRPKEVYDGAIPSGNSIMAYNLFTLSKLNNYNEYEYSFNQLNFLNQKANLHPINQSFYLLSLIEYYYNDKKIICILKDKNDLNFDKLYHLSVNLLLEPNNNYPILNNKTTFYVCEGRTCKSPTNNL
jgi:hypothetical protein